MPEAAPTRRYLVAAIASVLALAVAAAFRGGTTMATSVLVADASFPAAMAVLPGGNLLYGERLTGRIVEVAPDGSTQTRGRVPVSTEGEQRGLVGLAIGGDGEIYASFTAQDRERRLTIQRVSDGSTVWLGPPSADRSNGGRIAFAPDGSLVIGVGDLLDADAARDPSTPNGKFLALDPKGQPNQTPEVVSMGWNNPFAFAFARDGTLYVADNAGGDGAERLVRVLRGGERSQLATLPDHSVPSGLAVLADGRVAVCSYLTRTIAAYTVSGALAVPGSLPLAADCSIGVVTLPTGDLAYADEWTIRILALGSSPS